MTLIVVSLALALALLAVAVIYNGLIKLRLMADNAWSDIDVQLKRRHDLIPNLVEAAKGYMGFEQTTLERVVQARSQAMAAKGPEAKGEAELSLQKELRAFFVVAEDYPDLRASEQVLKLQESLVDVEETLQNARRYYNAVVRDYNTRIAQIPFNLVAGMFRFRPREFFEISAHEAAVPKVEV